MAHHSFSYKGYNVLLASKQKSKAARGGKFRSMQICLPNGDGYVIKKSFRYDITDVYAHAKASKKVTDWIDQHPVKPI